MKIEWNIDEYAIDASLGVHRAIIYQNQTDGLYMANVDLLPFQSIGYRFQDSLKPKTRKDESLVELIHWAEEELKWRNIKEKV